MPAPKHAARYANLLAALVFLLPFAIYPAYLLEGAGKPVFIPDGELVHLVPRLLLIGLVALLGWRFWQARGLFGGLMLGYLATVGLSTLAANDPGGWAFALFGPKARMDGLAYQVLLVLLGLASYSLLRQSPQQGERILWALAAGGSLQALLVVLQRIGVDPVGYAVGGSAYDEPMGTMGHIGVAGGLFLITLIALLHLIEGSGGLRRWGVLLLILWITLALGVTQNRAAVYALLPALLIYIALKPSWGRFILSLGMVAVVFLGPNTLFGPPERERGYTNMATLKSRLVMWQFVPEVLGHIRGAPWLGGGADAFLLVLTEHFSSERLLEFYRVEHQWPPNAVVQEVESLPPPEKGRERVLQVFFSQYGEQRDFQAVYMVGLDKAHNMFLDRLVAYGIFAALIWLVLLAYPVLALWRRGMLRSGVLWLVLPAVGIYYLAWFPVVQLEPIFVVLLALLWASAEPPKP